MARRARTDRMSRVTAAGVQLLALAMALVILAPAHADATPSGPVAHREVLPNGIVLLVAERPAVPIVAVRLYHRAGASWDPPGQAGLANLTGALLTRGTAKRSGTELDSAIEFVGGRLEAWAGRDGMTVSLSVLRKDLALGLDLVQEVVRQPTFPEAEFTRKVGEILASIQRAEENPQGVAARALSRLVYPSHPYGVPVEGTRESVAALTRDDVVRFHRERVRPDATLIAVVGAITVDEARREVMARFGSWARPSTASGPVPQPATPAPPKTEQIARDLTQATIFFGRQAIDQKDPDYFALSVASYILGGGSASRLYERVREQGGLAYSVGTFVSPAKYGSSFGVTAQTRTAEVARVIDIVRDELDRMRREPVTDLELELARAYLIGSFPLRLDTSSKVADFIIGVEEMGLGLDYADRYRERVGRVTAADVQRAAARFFAPDAFSRVVVGAVP
jgi:zinc protease